MDLLLDVNVIVDICAKQAPFFRTSLDAVALCIAQRRRLWIYTGSIQTLDYVLRDALQRRSQQMGTRISQRQAALLSRTLLNHFSQGKHWLAAIAEEGAVFASPDPEDEQLIRALDRFAPGTCKLLTRDESLIQAYPEKTLSPEHYCQLSGENCRLQFIDLKTQQDAIRPQLEKNIHRVLHHGKYIMGPEVKQLEAKLAHFVGVEHCITVSSGTDALLIAMMALGIGVGDEVITTPFTFIATGEMIALLGAKPVFVDIDPRTYNLDPNKIESAITPATKAIMPVSLYGQCADMDAINSIAEQHHLPVIEDGAQSFGATYKGRQSCGLSIIGSTSFFPSKPLGGYGDGGALFTNDDALAKAMREISVHGQDQRYHHPRIGLNGRMDTLQAAIVLAKLKRIDWEVAQRQHVAQRYNKQLIEKPHRNTQQESEGCSVVQSSSVVIPYIESHNISVYAQYTIQIENRDTLVQQLNDHGIPTAIHYPVPLHLQPAFTGYGYQQGHCPIAESIAKRVLSLPMGPDLDGSDLNLICAIIRQTVYQSG